jgi:hypothetical protein
MFFNSNLFHSKDFRSLTQPGVYCKRSTCPKGTEPKLENGRKTVFEVMSDVGYSDDKAFREVFKKITGLSPLDYKAKYTTSLQ